MTKKKLFDLSDILITSLIFVLAGKGFGFLGDSLSSFYLFCSFSSLLLINLYRRYNDLKEKIITLRTHVELKQILGYCLIVLSFILSLAYKTNQIYPVLAIPLLLIGLDSVSSHQSTTKIILLSSSLYTIFLLLLNYNYLFPLYVNKLSQIISYIITLPTGTPSIIGYSIGGFIIAISLLFISISTIIFSERKKNLYLCSIMILLAWLAYIFYLGVTNFNKNSDTTKFLPIFYILTIPFLLYQVYISRPKIVTTNAKSIPTVVTLILLFLSVTVLTLSYLPQNTTEKKILFYGENMLGSWDTPEYGKYGKLAPGMFGLLPYYLDVYGYNCSIFTNNITEFLEKNQPREVNITRYVNLTEYVNFVESDKITEDLLSNYDVFVLINVNTTFQEDEKNAIWEFVKRGGSLLVLGDHTGIGGLMDSFNDLLEKVGIEFRFDSALPLDPNNQWITCYHMTSNPINFGITNEEIEISVGASLNTTYPSFPVITGKFAFSDYGNITNAEGAYLGDYKYNKGEILGDIILVAGSYYGKGRVLVFGDTTTFQNPSLPLTHRFVNRIFSWLTSGETGTTVIIQHIVSLILILSFTYIVYAERNNIKIIPIIILAAILFSTSVNTALVSDTIPEGKLLYIDTTHINGFSISPFDIRSLTGTMINFARNGYLPMLLRDFDYNKINRSSILLIVAPNKPFSHDDVEKMIKFMKNGGLLILSAGYHCRDCVKPLLEKFKLDIENIPLGPVPYVEENPEEHQMEPKFVDAWPILMMNRTAVSYYDIDIKMEANQTR